MIQAKSARFLAALFAGALLTLPLAAAEEKVPAATQPYVVVVGISNYADKHIKPRPHAEDDARALYKLFTDKKYLGVDADHARLLLGDTEGAAGSQKATRQNILKALRWQATSARANDLVIFVYLGEGGPLGVSGDRRCYFAADSTFEGREKDAVSGGDVTDALKALKSQRFCVMLDVDFKGFTTDEKVAEVALGSVPYKEFLGDDGSEDHMPQQGRVVYLATNGLSRSVDTKEHGIFTAAIVAGLKGAADKDGYEPDGVVTVDELAKYLDDKMKSLAREYGKTREEREQSYFALGGRSNHFPLTHNPAVTDKVVARVTKLQQLIKDGKVPAHLSAEGTSLLERMPRLEAQRKLRKQYQALVDGKIDADTFTTARDKILSSTKLDRADAKEFAKKIIDIIDLAKAHYVKEVDRSRMVTWAIRGLYTLADEQVPADIEEQLKKVKTLDEDDLAKLLADARQELGKREDLAEQKDVFNTLQIMLSHLDPYTTFFDPDAVRKMKIELGSFTGIGVQIRKDSASDMLLVVTPIKGSPAYKAGIEAGDIITTVTREVDDNGDKLDEPEVISTKGLPLNDAVRKILGKRGTRVKLTVKREGAEDPLHFTITRAAIEVESVLGVKRSSKDDWDYMLDPVNKIAYVRLTSFARNTYRDLDRVMTRLTEEDGIKGFILDLRFNPGGLLDSAVKISDLFIDDGLIVTIRPRPGTERETKFRGEHRGSLLDFPMVCLVNGQSASGSEIVSAALQDWKRAFIMGERSYGKGSVQNIMPLDDIKGSELKMTTASFWRPSNKNLNKASTSGKEEDEWGVTPDKVIKLTRKEREDLFESQHNSEIIQPKGHKAAPPKSDFKDRQLESALDYLREQIKMAARADSKKAG
jgi:C-terminal peptidase prc